MDGGIYKGDREARNTTRIGEHEFTGAKCVKDEDPLPVHDQVDLRDKLTYNKRRWKLLPCICVCHIYFEGLKLDHCDLKLVSNNAFIA